MSYTYPKVTGETVFAKDPADGKVKLLDTIIQLLRTADTDISEAVETLSSKLNLDRCPIGASMWWWGTAANIPTGWIIMDGSSLPVATYPELYAIIGTAYGGDATNFNVPDLITERRFIRANNAAGEEEEDAIRNITAYLYRCIADPSTYGSEETKGGRGAIRRENTGANGFDGGSNAFWSIRFDASQDYYDYGNPTHGHTGGEIKPINTTGIPILRVA